MGVGERCGQCLPRSRRASNVIVKDLDLLQLGVADGRRLEVVADGLPLFGSAQLAIDATLVTTLRADGTARRKTAQVDGVALGEGRRRKERVYPELLRHHSKARLVVQAFEVGGPVVARDEQFLFPSLPGFDLVCSCWADGDTPAFPDVEQDCWFAGLSW